MRPFRFGLTTGWVASGESWLAMARRAEELGYDVLLVPDHLTHLLSPGPALAAAAAVTTRMRVGAYVFANDFRHPLVLAREAATLDAVSRGRFEFGIGAGWRVSDYRQLGVAYDPAGRRIDRLVEALGIIKRLLAGEMVTHDGPHYRIGRARIFPSPVQKPRPPVMLGGGGPRMLRLAAREADIVSFVPQFNAAGRPMLGQATERALVDRVAMVRAAAGGRFDQLELNVFIAAAGMVGSGNALAGSVAAGVLAALAAPVGSRTFSTAPGRGCARFSSAAESVWESATTASRSPPWSRWRPWCRTSPGARQPAGSVDEAQPEGVPIGGM